MTFRRGGGKIPYKILIFVGEIDIIGIRGSVMKKVIEVEDMCCAKCAERAEKKLRLLDGVTGAKANFKKGIILVESSLSDEALVACVTDAGFTVKGVRERKGLFG